MAAAVNNQVPKSGTISPNCVRHVANTKNLVSIDGVDNQAYLCNECAKRVILYMIKNMKRSQLEEKKVRIVSQSENGHDVAGNLFYICPTTFELKVSGIASTILEK